MEHTHMDNDFSKNDEVANVNENNSSDALIDRILGNKWFSKAYSINEAASKT